MRTASAQGTAASYHCMVLLDLHSTFRLALYKVWLEAAVTAQLLELQSHSAVDIWIGKFMPHFLLAGGCRWPPWVCGDPGASFKLIYRVKRLIVAGDADA